MSFAQPWWLLALIVPAFVAWRSRRKDYLPFSSTSLLDRGVGKSRVMRLLAAAPVLSLTTALTLAIVALSGPRVLTEQAAGQVMGRDIVVAMDISGSMSYKMPGWNVAGQGDRRIDAAQYAFRSFVLNREHLGGGDRIGLILFDDSPRLSWPLTNELKQLHRKSDHLPRNLGGPGGLGSGTNFGQKGFGPIEAAARHFEEYGQSPARVLVLITDGEEKLPDNVKSRLVNILSSTGARLYVVGVGPTLARQDVDIAKVARSAGGKVFRVETAGELESCFAEISTLEQGQISVGFSNTYLELYQYPAFAALAALLFWLLLAALVVAL